MSDVEILEDSPDDEEWFEQARYPIELNLPAVDAALLGDAREAVKREYRDSVKWKRLRCRKVEVVAGSHAGTLFVMRVGHSVEFDWTWEGAIAFRPVSMEDTDGDTASVFDQDDFEAPDIEDSILWAGEILEVDEAAGCIYLCVSNPEHPPQTGSFFVRPFEFLGFLNGVFHEPAFAEVRQLLPSRLLAAEGNVHPQVNKDRSVGLPALRHWWSKSWSVLWGPPGTGKTYTTGQQVAHALADPSERILVVSTTNRATDAVAISIGQAAKLVAPAALTGESMLRIGKGAALRNFETSGLTSMLQGTETEFLARIEQHGFELSRAREAKDKALIRREIIKLREQMRDAAQRNFLDKRTRVVVATAFKATTFLKREEVRASIADGQAPYTTIFVDEAGLISRAAVAALSLLASRRVVLVGDSKQLAPISRISRILPTNQMKWLAMSGLSHLDTVTQEIEGVVVLREQRRMHDDICRIVSAYQYDNCLVTAPEVRERIFQLPAPMQYQPRAIWYVLDDDGGDLPSIRAERGPGNRSWIRLATLRILDRLFASPEFCQCNGLFISPYKAQARSVAKYFAENDITSWSASTVHSQQGAEADIVLFDSVNAGSYSWPYDEWQRLVNVAISRARECVILFASRAEMHEPYLRPLVRHLRPRVMRKQGRSFAWEEVATHAAYVPPQPMSVHEPSSIGYQLARRKELRPVLSHEQQRLCGLELDGKPRLVRGVAGSGKTVVLAHWLMQTVKRLHGQPNIRIWAVFANRSLQTLISDSIASAWEQATGGTVFPWQNVSLRHIREILDVVLPEVGLDAQAFGFDYDQAAAAYMLRIDVASIQPRCDALFIDEAQDMGPHALKLLTSLTRQTNLQDSNSRSVNIFYDNAQNIYDRDIPKWSDLGLDMRGRSSVMKESFRSTKPITEFALNVLCRLQPQESNPDFRELIARGLVERTLRDGGEWWSVSFNQVSGPDPEFRRFASEVQEQAAIVETCRKLVVDEGVQPADICLIYNSQHIKSGLTNAIAPQLSAVGIELAVQSNQPFGRNPRSILATTSASFKGYDAEVVLIPGINYYCASSKGVLANNLYVAMTRSRSILMMFGHQSSSLLGLRIFHALESCLDCLSERPRVENHISPQDDFVDMLAIVGEEHRQWLTKLWAKYSILQEPLFSARGELIAEPLFWFRVQGQTHACFGRTPPPQRTLQKLEDANIILIHPGQ